MDIQEILRDEYVDVAEAAKMLDLSGIRIRELCLKGRFHGAFRFGPAWIIPRAAVQAHKRLPPGRKPKAARRADDAALIEAALREASRSSEGEG